MCDSLSSDTQNLSMNDFLANFPEVESMVYCLTKFPYIEVNYIHRILFDSYGLRLDIQIVHEMIKHIPLKFSFYYEHAECSHPTDWLFINIDTTKFTRLLKDAQHPSVFACKTQQCVKYATEWSQEHQLQQKILYTGFTSIDRFVPSVLKSYDKWIHIAGKSPFKGSFTIAHEWMLHPEYPPLTMIIRDHSDNDYLLYKIKLMFHNLSIEHPKNLIIWSDYISDNDIQTMINEHGVHICASMCEGFGHTMNEARSTEALILYTNGEPMTEFFEDGINGIAIDCIKKNSRFFYENDEIILKDYYYITPSGLQHAIHRVMQLSHEMRQSIGKRAREKFLVNDAEFKVRIVDLVENYNSTL